MSDTESRFANVPMIANPQEHRCPCVLLLDTSSSMSKNNAIGELNRGLRIFAQSINDDALARKRVEVAVITFDSSAQLRSDFCIASDFRPEEYHASGSTAMGGAIQMAMDLIEQRKAAYDQSGALSFRPWIFLITDGEPTDVDRYDPKGISWSGLVQDVRSRESRGKFTLFAVGTKGADFVALNELSARGALELMGVNFRELFVWLSRSLSVVSGSNPGDGEAPLPPPNWGAVPT